MSCDKENGTFVVFYHTRKICCHQNSVRLAQMMRLERMAQVEGILQNVNINPILKVSTGFDPN